MSREENRIKITFGDTGSPPELEVSTPLQSNAGTRMWPALASLRVKPSSPYLVRNESRLIIRVKLNDRNGKPLSQHRAVQVMGALNERLSDGGTDQSAVMCRGETGSPSWTNPTPIDSDECWTA
jgi:hypothetical protein